MNSEKLTNQLPEDEVQASTNSQFAVLYIPIIFSVVGLAAIYYDPAYRVFIIGIGVSLIFGFTLSTLARFIENASDFRKGLKTAKSSMGEIKEDLAELKAQNILLREMADDRRLSYTNNLLTGIGKTEDIARQHPAMAQFCEWKTAQIEEIVRELVRHADDGKVVIDDPRRELTSSIELLQTACTKEVLAVSFEDTPFWDSNEGRSFLAEHKNAIARGVKITRIFIIESDDETQLAPIMKQQVDVGVTVLKVSATDVKDLNPSDVVIYDENLVRMGYNEDYTKNNMFKGAQLVVAPEVVRKQKQMFDALAARSEEVHKAGKK